MIEVGVAPLGVSTEVCKNKPTSATSTNWLPREVPREAVSHDACVFLFIICCDFSSLALSPPVPRLSLLLAQVTNGSPRVQKNESQGTSYFDSSCNIFPPPSFLPRVTLQNERCGLPLCHPPQPHYLC